ncbi:cytochrome C nitrite reductase [Trinickia dinghuensis]|uniref:Cytochrome C nitrite reductase n=1 Tax=Trinickia dinghuensis TaxID=2291023 RepID=A0A3D8JYM4_9BURK|nr:cytochrome C nitrite reductase [Trinickia dinghuensis]
MPGAPLKSFDIGFAQGGVYALSDRSNASVDLIDTHNHRFLARVGGFAGARGDQSGPNGVVLVDQREVWAGDGNSQVRIIDLKSHRVVALVSTGGTNRVDELAYDPRDHLIVAANNADNPPFVTLISSDPPYAVRSKIEFKRATSGIEQSVWDPQSGNVFVAIPELDGKAANGAIGIIDPKQGKLIGMDPVSECMPAGLVMGPAPQMLVGCSDDAVKAGFAARSLLLDARTGKVIKAFDRVGGSDEIWYDPSTRHYALAAVANLGGPVVGVIDAQHKRWLGNLPSGKAAHSVASDNGTIFVPVAAGDKACPNGCVEVFAH